MPDSRFLPDQILLLTPQSHQFYPDNIDNLFHPGIIQPMNKSESVATEAHAAEDRQPSHCIAFEGQRCIGSGALDFVARKAKQVFNQDEFAPIFIFDDVTSKRIEIDFRGTTEDVVERLERTEASAVATPEIPEKRGPGRPRLGVIPREVTLLPRHWDWLNQQPGGASVALRKLVEAAKRSCRAADRARQSQEAVHRFMYPMAGDFPDFEEAARAFYAGNHQRFDELVAPWPADVRDHLRKLVAVAIQAEAAAAENP